MSAKSSCSSWALSTNHLPCLLTLLPPPFEAPSSPFPGSVLAPPLPDLRHPSMPSKSPGSGLRASLLLAENRLLTHRKLRPRAKTTVRWPNRQWLRPPVKTRAAYRSISATFLPSVITIEPRRHAKSVLCIKCSTHGSVYPSTTRKQAPVAISLARMVSKHPYTAGVLSSPE